MILSWGLFSHCKDKGQKPKETNKQPFKVFNDTPIKTLNTFTLFKTVAQPTVFSKCHPKSSSSSLKLISNEMVLAVSIANQIVVFTSQILRDMAITLTPNSHTHPKPKQFFSYPDLSKQRFLSTKMLFPFVEPTGSSLLKLGWDICKI